MDATGNASDANRRNLQLLISLRWLAVAGQVSAIAFVHLWLGISLPVDEMGLVILFLIGLNLVGICRVVGQAPIGDKELCVDLLLDVAALTLQLYLSGGATNPFIFLYLLQVILGAVLLPPLATWIMVGATSLAFVGLTYAYRPIDFGSHAHPEGAFLLDLHLQGMFLCFLLAAVLVVRFVTRMTTNLRARDAYLAELRQREAEETQIVRLGLLASGAAHDLGTPLSTIAVILSDWRRMGPFRDDPAMREELGEVQAALARCKATVSQILIAAGEVRGESARRATLSGFVDELVARWADSRRPAALDFENATDADLEIASDSVIEQALFNVFDNALEASPDWIGIDAERRGADLLVRVSDHGPGFSAAALERLGKPYHSEKGEAGRGLGLFLTVSVLRKLGGGIRATNPGEGGACVEIRLPIQSLAVEDADAA